MLAHYTVHDHTYIIHVYTYVKVTIEILAIFKTQFSSFVTGELIQVQSGPQTYRNTTGGSLFKNDPV